MDNDFDLVAEIVSAYVGNNECDQYQLIEMIRAVHDVFAELRAEAPTPQTSANDADLTDTREPLFENQTKIPSREPLFEVDAPVTYCQYGDEINDK